jgi:CheY-like chemotaxis protein
MSELIDSLQEELTKARGENEELRKDLLRVNLQKLALCEIAQRKLRDFAREFRVPLASVLGFTDLLSVTYRGDTTELNQLATAGHQLMDLVTTLEKAQALSLLEDEPVNPISVEAPSPAASPSHVVLHVEDNETNFRLVARILEDRNDLSVVWAKTGIDGINQSVQKIPSLVLLDLNLPDIHGSELLHQLKNNPATKDIPVIILSADVNPTQIERMLQAGASNYLTKPFEIKRLLCLVDEALAISGESVAA